MENELNRRDKHIKSTKGFTLIELIIAMALSTIVIAMIFSYLFYTMNSWKIIKAESENINSGKIVLIYLDQEIRQAVSATANGYAVTINTAGNRINVATYINGVKKNVSYLVENNILKRGVSPEGSQPTIWQNMLNGVQPMMSGSTAIPYFSVTDTNKIKITLLTDNADANVSRPIELTNTFEIRSKGQKAQVIS